MLLLLTPKHVSPATVPASPFSPFRDKGGGRSDHGANIFWSY